MINFSFHSPIKVEAVSIDGATPLSNSCSSGSAACVRLLLQHRASVHTPSLLTSPIHEAVKKGALACKDMWVMKPWLCDTYYRFWCCGVSLSGHRECLELLLLCGSHIDMELPEVGTPLYSACTAQAADCVKLLLHSGKSNNKFNHKTNSLNVIFGCINFTFVCWTKGADVGLGCGQDSPLHAAVRCGAADVVDLLLDFGADGCCRNAEGKTPLDLASPNSAVRLVLLKKGEPHHCLHVKHINRT